MNAAVTVFVRHCYPPTEVRSSSAAYTGPTTGLQTASKTTPNATKQHYTII